MITALQALEALDELESSARGDEPFNHAAAPLIRAFIESAELAKPARHMEEQPDGTMMKWIPFDQLKWSRQPLPPVKKPVLVRLAEQPEKGHPMGTAVGYVRFAAGDKNSPAFVIPGIGGNVIAWCDCLSDDFTFYS